MEESTHFQAASKNRLFYSLPDKGVNDQSVLQSEEDHGEKLLKYISENTIGKNKVFSGPFGLRRVTYLDYIASGRPLKFIEDYICNEVLPDYGNTHTTTSVTSLQTTLYRHEARDIIRNSVHASEHDSVIFCGSGTTGAVHKLIHALNLSQPPVVFVGPYEHHSSFLPWEAIGAKIVRIKQDEKGRISIYDLQQNLQKWKATNQQLIGCFSAASNITGILVNVNAVTVCLHKNGALAFWDYATAAPYVKLDMNPVVTSSEDQPYVYKDAMFLSPHKFVGGVQTPGVLVAKKKLFNNTVPEKCGGGSVFYVRRDGHRFLQEPELREEGGTPAIVEAIRAGLVFQLKDAVTSELIMKKEEELFRHAVRCLKNCENLVILGNIEVPRLPVFSFLVYNPQSGRFLHHNFVASILNDLFGIQARGGCACAGPYAMDLLGLDEKTASEIEDLLAEDTRLDRTHLRRYREYSQREILRPGFVRINLPFFLEPETLDFALEAIKIVAKDGWKLLPQYMFNPETGEWRQRNFQVFKDRKWLGHISYNSGEMKYQVPPHVVKGPLPTDYKDCLQKVRHLFQKVEKSHPQLPDHRQMFDDKTQRYRWFMLPSEAATCLSGDPISSFSSQLPFCPPQIREEIGLPPFVLEVQKNDGVVVDSHFEICQISDSAKQRSDKFADGLVQRLENGYNCDDSNVRQYDIDSTKNHDIDSTKNCDIDSQVSSFIDSKQKCDVVPCATEEKASKGFEKMYNDETLEISDTCSTTKYPKTYDLPVEQGVCNKLISGDRSGTPVIEEYSNLCDKVKVREGGSNRVGSEQNGASTGEECPEVFHSQTDKEQKAETAEAMSSHAPDLLVCNSLSSVSTTLHLNKKRDRCKEAENACEFSADSEMCTLPKNRKFVSSNKVESPNMFTTCDSATTKSACTRKTEAILPKMGTNDTAEKRTKSESTGGKGKKSSKWYSPPKCIFTPFLKGVEEYSMIRNGDNVLVCLSGGKDSLSLLHTVRQYQFYSRSKGIHFQLGAVTVDPQTNSYDPSPLKQYLASLNVPYFYESQCIMEQAKSLSECASICSFCSRMKRGRIYACARKNGYNVLALGQHLDDLCESFLMSFFHNGILRTMKAHYGVEEGDLRVIRPFVYVREKDLRTFAEKNKLPVIAENCPACFDAPKERHRTKQLLAAQEILFPQIYNSMMAAMKPVMAINKTGVKVKDYLARQEEDDLEI